MNKKDMLKYKKYIEDKEFTVIEEEKIREKYARLLNEKKQDCIKRMDKMPHLSKEEREFNLDRIDADTEMHGGRYQEGISTIKEYKEHQQLFHKLLFPLIQEEYPDINFTIQGDVR